jgi:hypothetical protein
MYRLMQQVMQANAMPPEGPSITCCDKLGNSLGPTIVRDKQMVDQIVPTKVARNAEEREMALISVKGSDIIRFGLIIRVGMV